MIKRELHLAKIRDFYDSTLIKVILGVRRSGKSELMKQIIEELKDKGIKESHIIYINFEDINYDDYLNAKSLNNYIQSKLPTGGKYYLLFDEIQLVENYEKVVNSLRATEDVSIFLTGSNASMLSGDMATLLSGRYVSFQIMPFTFAEVMEYYDSRGMIVDKDKTFLEYIKWGGFPQQLEQPNDHAKQAYLEDVLYSIVYRDILKDEKKADKKLISSIIRYLIENTGKIFSDNKVYNILNERTMDLRKNTTYEAIDGIVNAMVVSKCQRYDIKRKEVMKLLEKYYVSDLGLKKAMHLNDEIDHGSSLETIIYNDLIAKGYEVYVGKTQKGEIDFLVKTLDDRVYIQVCYTLGDEKTREREFNAFKDVKDSYKKYVISMDKEDYSKDGIIHLNAIEYLMGKVKI